MENENFDSGYAKTIIKHPKTFTLDENWQKTRHEDPDNIIDLFHILVKFDGCNFSNIIFRIDKLIVKHEEIINEIKWKSSNYRLLSLEKVHRKYNFTN